MTNSVALADAAGSPAGAESVIVPVVRSICAQHPRLPRPSTRARRSADARRAGPRRCRRLSRRTSHRLRSCRRRRVEPSAATEDQFVAEVRGLRFVGCRVCLGRSSAAGRPARIDAWIARLESKVAEKVREEHRLRPSSPRTTPARASAPTPRLPADAGTPVRTRPVWFDVRFEERSIAGSPRLTRLPLAGNPQARPLPAPGVPQHRGLLRGQTARALTPSGSRRRGR